MLSDEEEDEDYEPSDTESEGDMECNNAEEECDEEESEEEEQSDNDCDKKECLTQNEDEEHLLGNQIWHLWNNCKQKLLSDYAVAGWFLSMDPLVRKDCAVHAKGTDHLTVDHLIKRLLSNEKEFDQFLNK